MSILPEVLLRTVIVRGMRTIRENPILLDQLFKNLDALTQEDMRNFILKNKIWIHANYPREDLLLPAIVLLLRNEQEHQTWLGESMGLGVKSEFVWDDRSNETLPVVKGAASLSGAAGLGELKFGPFMVSEATSTTLTIATREWDIDEYKRIKDTEPHTVRIIGGLGTGQIRDITANSQVQLTVSQAWSLVPDDTSVFEIRGPEKEIVGEPKSIYTADQSCFVERLGPYYDMTYQIQIITENPTLTILLHAIMKMLFILSRQFMEEQGLIDFELSATDYVNAPPYAPIRAYMRAMQIRFKYPFEVFSELQDLAESFRIVLEAKSDDVSVVLSDTTC